MSKTLFDFIASVLLIEESNDLSQELQLERRDFVMRFQQLTGPVTAKGVEDTAFYRHFPLASLCEVGGNPKHFGVSVKDFHSANVDRLKEWPHTLLATATHDTKRGEDVRARLNVLSEIPERWDEAVRRWQKENQTLKTVVNEILAPDPIEEYLIYQTLVGTFPFRFEDNAGRESYVSKIQDYLIKALREAKIHSSWLDPMEDYEAAVRGFLNQLLGPGSAFLDDFTSFQERIAAAGVLNSLSQTLLKITSPGVPDFYQGTEAWDFSLVDPDNRKLVDYERLRNLLSSTKTYDKSFLEDPSDGAIKLLLTSRLLAFRNQHRDLFDRGDYLPLAAKGALSHHVISFVRRYGDEMAVVIAPRFMYELAGAEVGVWNETWLEIDSEATGCYRDVITGQSVCVSETKPRISLSQAFQSLPVTLLVRDA